MLTLVREKLSALPRVPEPPANEDFAAVLLAITRNEAEPALLLTQRAQHMNSHSGEVALPGGKWERHDINLEQTALRETWEEVGLKPDAVEVMASLPTVVTGQGVSVAPYVGLIDEGVSLTANEDELDAMFYVPLRFFLEDRRIRTDIFNRNVGHNWAPAYDFQGYEIWGFTAHLVASFLNRIVDAGIRCKHPAPVKDWSAIIKARQS